ncbi:MAG: oxidoreductase [Pseudonocardiaceae bacterium]|nr:oxidoreductase [Pseudonocardiaceae bacterium]
MTSPPADPLGPLFELPGVADAVEAARSAIDEVHRHPANRRGWPTTAAAASVRAARASAALDGGSVELPADGSVDDPVLAGALRVAEALGGLLNTWQRAPLQALARLHVLAAADLVGDEGLGRPAGPQAALNPALVSARLDTLGRLVVGATRAPGPVQVAVVHGELLALQAFGSADGVVARAAARLSAIATGLDPKGLVVPEVAHLRRESEYRAAAAGFATGEHDALATWIVHCCDALVAGSREARSIADAAGTGS